MLLGSKEDCPGLNEGFIYTNDSSVYFAGTQGIKKYVDSLGWILQGDPITASAMTVFSDTLFAAFGNTIKSLDPGTKTFASLGTVGASSDVVQAIVVNNQNGNRIIYALAKSAANALTLWKYSNSVWLIVGTSNFISTNSNSILIVDNNIPYVCFTEIYNGFSSVMRFLNNDWEYVGEPGFTKLPANGSIDIFNNALYFNGATAKGLIFMKRSL